MNRVDPQFAEPVATQVVGTINRSPLGEAEPRIVEAPRLPDVLARSRRKQVEREFLAEYAPIGPTEQALVRALARHTVAVERWGLGAEAVAREAARTLPHLAQVVSSASGANPAHQLDTVLSAALTTEAVDRCERHALAHARALHRTLDKLQDLQRQRTEQGSLPPAPFPDEAACQTYLVNRFLAGECTCQRCDSKRGHFLHSRNCWECAACKTQTGLRAGSVLARSPVSLWCWFEAIRLLLWQPTISTPELGAKLAIRRTTTVRTMAQRIRGAMAAENAKEQLAGLNDYFARVRPAPDSSV
jgi:hypothetical protein